MYTEIKIELILLDEYQGKCIQYQEEISNLQKEIDKHKIDLEMKEKLVDDSKHFVHSFYNTLKDYKISF